MKRYETPNGVIDINHIERMFIIAVKAYVVQLDHELGNALWLMKQIVSCKYSTDHHNLPLYVCSRLPALSEPPIQRHSIASETAISPCHDDTHG